MAKRPYIPRTTGSRLYRKMLETIPKRQITEDKPHHANQILVDDVQNVPLTTKQAAEILGVNPSRIRQLVLSGELHAEKVGRDLFISQAEMDRFMRERTTAKAKRKGRMT